MSRGGELVFKTKKTSEKISENIHIFANDPSLAFFRVQEHVRKVSPAIFEKRDEVFQLQNKLQGHCYDMEYGIQYVSTSTATQESLTIISVKPLSTEPCAPSRNQRAFSITYRR